MTWELPPGLGDDETLLVEVLDDLADRALREAAPAVDDTGTIDRRIRDLLGDNGFLDPLGDPRLTLLVVERLARSSAAVSTIPAGAADARAAWAGTASRRPVLIDGGSRPIAATIDGSGWRLDGDAPRVEWATEADRLAVLATADDGEVVFEVDPTSSGVETGPIEATSGLLGTPVQGLRFAAARVVGAEPVGGPAEVQRARRHRALTSAAMAVALSAVAVEAAVAYAGQRRQFGRRLSEFAALRTMLADMETRTRAAAALLWTAVPPGEWGEMGGAAARAGRVAIDTALSVTRDAVQIHGGYGYIREQPVERFMRDSMSVAARTGPRFALLEDLASTLLPA